MQLDEFHTYCLSLPGAEETTPFGPDVVVYKVGGKMFALASPDDFPHRVNLKCDPERAMDLRDRHPEITPGYHMNKRHWISVAAGPQVTERLLEELVENAYLLVLDKLSRAERSQVIDANQ